MNIKKQSEEIIQWTDNSSNFKEVDVDVKLEVSDTIDKVRGTDNVALFTIIIRMKILAGDSKVIFNGIIQGVYTTALNKDTTLHQFAMVYLRPYSFFKSEFDKYKTDKSIAIIEVPELKEDHVSIVSAFKTKLPDILKI